MKQLVFALLAVTVFAGPAYARNVYVAGHYLANGKYVPPHYVEVPDGPVYPGYSNGDPEGNAAPVPYPYGAPYAPYGAAPYGAAPYQAAPYVPAPGYVPNYGYIPR